MVATGQIFQISKFTDTLSFVIVKKRSNLHTHKFTQSGCIPPRLKCKILAHKGSQTAMRSSRLLEPQTNRTTGPPNVTDYGSRFPGKRNPLLTRFFFFFLDLSIAKWSVKEDDTTMNEVAKGKQKTRGNNKKKKKKKKTAKCAVEEDYESTNSFQNYDSRQLFSIQMFLYQSWYLIKKGKARF